MSIVEKMAEDACNAVGITPHSDMRIFAERAVYVALTTTVLTEAQLEGLAAGTHVVVPVEPTEVMKEAFQWGSVLPGEIVNSTNAGVWRAMLAAKEG